MKHFINWLLFFIVAISSAFLTRHFTLQERVLSIQGSVPPSTYTITEIHHVVDGDTFDATIKLPLGIAYTGRVRCKGYDAYEMSEPKGKPAREYLNTLIKISKFYIAIDEKWHDNFGRVLGSVSFVDSSGNLISLSDDMRIKGFVNETSIWSKNSNEH